jgi:hypothetical protein
MTTKTSTFAGQLEHFAQSVDVVDDRTFDAVRDLVCRYVTGELGGRYFELLRQEASVNGDRDLWLRTFWSSEERSHLWKVLASHGDYANPVTEAFDTDRPMWLVSPEGAPLNGATACSDLWSNTSAAVSYQPISRQPVRTAVVMPLRYRHPIGAYCIESARYIEITNVAKLEMRRLATALAILCELWDTNRSQSVSKQHAISDLRDMLNQAKFPRLAKPHVFVAFSNRADETVELIIKDVLRQFEDQLEFTDWSQMQESGNISRQISREIMESRYGVCYFSEPVESGGAASTRYTDNPNVVFEAGMLHARTTASADKGQGQPSGWIPIREEDSPPAPFDFATERILYVPRSRNGELNESKLKQMLTRRIIALLGEN